MSSLSIRDSKVAYSLILGAVNTYEFLLYHASKFILTPLLRAVVCRRMKRIADVTINPEEKSAKPGDLRVYNDKFYAMMAGYHSLGVGNAYMEGMWDSTDLEEFFFKSFSTDLQYEMDTFPSWHKFINYLKFGLFNLQTPARSWEVGQKHYDLSNDLFEKMLDKTMTYSCGYWKNADNLDAAQINKLDLLARKLQLKPGMKVLDIGCGWGGLCKYFAEVYKVEMVGCTISVEGARMGRVRCKGLPVDIRVVDYRDINETFDRIVSVGMFEHVGHRNYRTFFEVVHRCLKDDGIFALHTIAVNTKKMPIFDGWVNTYIFPNGSLPYPESICEASDDYFMIEDWQNMGYHYHKTLRAWLENFNKHWPSLKKNYDEPEKFYRMWTFYLTMSSALFKSRRMQLWQVVFTKKGMAGGYDAPR